MKRFAAIPKGATGVYRLDCSSSPRMYQDGERLTVVKKGPAGHCIVRNTAGIEQIIRDSELFLDEKCSVYQVPLPNESSVKIGGVTNDATSRMTR